MYFRTLVVLASLALPAALFAQSDILNPLGTSSYDAFQVNYASNLNRGDGVVNVTNAGTSAGTNEPISHANNFGDICANIYVYSPDQQLASCCTCLVSPNSIHSWPVSFGPGNLLQNVNNTTQQGLTSVVLKLLATTPTPRPNGTDCDPTNPLGGGAALAGGMAAWATHSHPTNTPTVAITETEFLIKGLSPGEFGKLRDDCTNLVTRFSGNFCPGCGLGGLAVPKTKL
jgi:hypothetical protein